MADGIVQRLAAVHGLAPEIVRAINARNSAPELGAFLCFLKVYAYLASPTDLLHAELGACIAEVVTLHPGYGGRWAALAPEIDPQAPSWFHGAPAFVALPGADDAALLAATEPLTTRSLRTELVIRFLAQALLRRIDAMAQLHEQLAEAGLPTANDVPLHVLNRRYHPDLQEELVRQLELAFSAEGQL